MWYFSLNLQQSNRTISFHGLFSLFFNIIFYPYTNHYVEKQKQCRKIGKTAHENLLSYFFAACLRQNIETSLFNVKYSVFQEHELLNHWKSGFNSNDSCWNQLLLIIFETYPVFDCNPFLRVVFFFSWYF